MRMLLGVRMAVELAIIIVMMLLAVVAYLKKESIKEYCSSLVKSEEIQSSPEELVEKNVLPDDTSTALRSVDNLRVNAPGSSEVSSQVPNMPAAKPFRYQKVKHSERIVTNRQTNKYVTKDIIVVTVPGSVKLKSADYEQRMNVTKEKISVEYGPIPVKVRHPSVKGYVVE